MVAVATAGVAAAAWRRWPLQCQWHRVGSAGSRIGGGVCVCQAAQAAAQAGAGGGGCAARAEFSVLGGTPIRYRGGEGSPHLPLCCGRLPGRAEQRQPLIQCSGGRRTISGAGAAGAPRQRWHHPQQLSRLWHQQLSQLPGSPLRPHRNQEHPPGATAGGRRRSRRSRSSRSSRGRGSGSARATA